MKTNKITNAEVAEKLDRELLPKTSQERDTGFLLIPVLSRVYNKEMSIFVPMEKDAVERLAYKRAR